MDAWMDGWMVDIWIPGWMTAWCMNRLGHHRISLMVLWDFQYSPETIELLEIEVRSLFQTNPSPP